MAIDILHDPMDGLEERIAKDPSLQAIRRILPSLPFSPFQLIVQDMYAGEPAQHENQDIINALATVTDPNRPEHDIVNAFNCGGNIYIKPAYRHWFWKQVGPAAIEGKFPGPGGSRYMNGTTESLLALEERAANFVGYKHALYVNTGYNAVEVAIDTLLTTGVSYNAKEKPIAIKARSAVHNSVEAPLRDIEQKGYTPDKVFRRDNEIPKPEFDPNDPETLVAVMEQLQDAPVTDKVVFINGVGSTDGQIYDLARIQQICKQYGALLFVDDAHGGFTLGKNAKGICEHLGLPELPDFYFATASKSLEAGGGFLMSNRTGVQQAFEYHRKVVFTAAADEWSLESIAAKLDYIEASNDEFLLGGESEKLMLNANRLNRIFERAGIGIFDTDPNTPIYGLKVAKIPGETNDDYRVRSYLAWYTLLNDFGVYTNFFPAEASGKGETLLRVSISSNMSTRVIKMIGAKFAQWNRFVTGQEAHSNEELADILEVSVDEVEELLAVSI